MSQLSKEERKEIEYYLGKGYSHRAIGKLLKRHHSVISREVQRNVVCGEYEGRKAELKSYQRRYWVLTNPKKIRCHDALEKYIEAKLRKKYPWSPEQIAGRWNRDHGKGSGIFLSYSTIYRYLYDLRPSLCQYLCTKRCKRKKRHKKTLRELIPNRVWIDDRPEIVAEKERIGDFEGDTIVSSEGDTTVLLVVHDRVSRFLTVRKCSDRKPKKIAKKMRALLQKLPALTLTLDSGVEFREHHNYGVPTFFCHPFSSWEKGGVEYGNRLLRRPFPKKSILKNISHQNLRSVVRALNATPRKCLGYLTPQEVFFAKSPPTPLKLRQKLSPLSHLG